MRTLVVLPTYNEILNVEPMLRTLRKVVPLCDVLVVDDGSPDGTANLAEEVGEDVGQIFVLRRDKKSGLGGAYRAGFAWGLEHGYDHFVEIDCDFSHDPNALPALLSAAEIARRRHRLALRPRRSHPAVESVASTALARRKPVRLDHARARGRRFDRRLPGLLQDRTRTHRFRIRDRRRLRIPDRDDVPRPCAPARRSSRCRSPSPTANWASPRCRARS